MNSVQQHVFFFCILSVIDSVLHLLLQEETWEIEEGSQTNILSSGIQVTVI